MSSDKETGRDYVNFICEGVETYVKDHVRDRVVSRLVAEFEKDITKLVEERLAEMVFSGSKGFDTTSLKDEMILLIRWAKTQEEYVMKYEMKGEPVKK